MPSSGWLAALTKHLSLSPLPSALPARPGDNGVSTVSSQEADDGPHRGRSLASRPTTPWSLDTLDEEIQRGSPSHHNHCHHQGKAAPRCPSSTTTTTPDLHSPPPLTHLQHHLGEVEVAVVSAMEGSHSVSRPTSASSGPPSASRPASVSSRPPSASRPASASALTRAGHRQLRHHAQANIPNAPTPASSPITTLPAQVEEENCEAERARGQYYIPAVIPPLYDHTLVAPTPASTRCNTPVWDQDGEKRVRFLEPEVVADLPSRPSSVNSQYSHIIKNSTRFAFQPMQPLMSEPDGHNPRYCNCPCHFFPLGRRSVGVQVKRVDPEPPRPRHYRLYLTPTTQGLDHVTFPAKSLSLITRALLSQVGLAVVVVVWWVAGAAIFSTVEGAAESETVNKMASLRTDLVLGLATELRQVVPHEVVWRTKIETYMGRMENAVLDAARAGYASRAPTWTMTGALLYSASLTTLVGPGGMTLRTGFSRIFAVLFSLVGAPLVLLLAISGAFTIREGVGRAWAWRCGRGRQGKVGDGEGMTAEGRAEQYGSGATGPGSILNLAGRPQSSISEGGNQSQEAVGHPTRVTPNGPGELPGTTGSQTSAKPRHPGGSVDIHQPSRVPALDSTLRSSSFSSSSSREGDIVAPSSATQHSVPDSTQTFPHNSQNRTMGVEQPFGVAPVIQKRGKPGVPLYPRRRGKTVPWPVYLGLLLAYIVLGLIIFAPIQRWSITSSVYIVFSTLLTLDHDGLGERHHLGTSKIIFPYVVYMLVGLVVVAALVISIWSSLCAALITTGKYLTVVKPTPR